MNIDWSRLEVCPGAGTAAEVPRAIEALFSNSAKQRRQAYWQLDNFVVVQGGLFESAAYAGRLLVQQIKAAPENVNGGASARSSGCRR